MYIKLNPPPFSYQVREHMYDNPYHNWAHVFDVTQV